MPQKQPQYRQWVAKWTLLMPLGPILASFRLRLGSPGPQKKQLKTWCLSAKSHFGPLWTGTFFRSRSETSCFHVFLHSGMTMQRKCAKMSSQTGPLGGVARSLFLSFSDLGGLWAPTWLQGLPRAPPGPPRVTILPHFDSNFGDFASYFHRFWGRQSRYFHTQGTAKKKWR